MNSNIFIPNCISKLDTLRDMEFKKHNFNYEEKVIEKKILNTNLVEFKNFQSNLKKKASLDKNKPSNIGKKEYSSNNSNFDILEDDIFNNNDIEKNENENDSKLEIEDLDRNKKIELVNDFLQRKNIILDEIEYKKIEAIIDNPEINIKKYLNISKLYQQVNKITFIKKLENGSYTVNLIETKPKKTKKFFNK